jgi:hypothetical protein
MTRKIILGFLTMVVMMSAFVIAFAKPDFNGSWALNKDKSIGVRASEDFVMSIKHEGDRIEVETKIITPQGERVVKDIYTLDEKEMEFTPQQPKSTGKRAAKWLPRGNGIMVIENIVSETPNGKVNIQFTRKWILSTDGKELIIDIYIDDPRGSFEVKRVFTKR